MTDAPSVLALLATLEEALDLLRPDARDSDGSLLPLPSLLEQCNAMLRTAEDAERPVLRSLHQFACTGGTLITSCLAAMPSAMVLNEIDPLSRLHFPDAQRRFWPSDITVDLMGGPRQMPDKTIIAVFRAGIETLARELADNGQLLVLRDHPHSMFCVEGVDPALRLTMREMLTPLLPIRSVLTVRHPIDSYASITVNNWRHFRPRTLEEYCRRYLMFLDRHAGLPIYTYEDFTADPNRVMKAICTELEMEYSQDFESTRHLFALSGDSGRKSAHIALRPRRKLDVNLIAEAHESACYAALCERLCYSPDPR